MHPPASPTALHLAPLSLSIGTPRPSHRNATPAFYFRTLLSLQRPALWAPVPTRENTQNHPHSRPTHRPCAPPYQPSHNGSTPNSATVPEIPPRSSLQSSWLTCADPGRAKLSTLSVLACRFALEPRVPSLAPLTPCIARGAEPPCSLSMGSVVSVLRWEWLPMWPRLRTASHRAAREPRRRQPHQHQGDVVPIPNVAPARLRRGSSMSALADNVHFLLACVSSRSDDAVPENCWWHASCASR